MLRIQKVEHLAKAIGTSESRIRKIANSASKFIAKFQLVDPGNPNFKKRIVFSVKGDLRQVQSRILTLLSKNDPEHICSHGGITNRSILTNASVHLASDFVYKTDISSFYPSISHRRVYKYFVTVQRCSPDVARILTMLTTFEHHVPLGLITSPFLADRILRQVDIRIHTACLQHGISYSRFVDDIVLSAKFNLRNSGFPRLVREIIRSCGFKVNDSKDEFADLQDGVLITGLRVKNGRIDVRSSFVRSVEAQIKIAEQLADGKNVQGVFATKSQVLGRLHFMRFVNSDRHLRLFEKFNSVDWTKAFQVAERRGLIAPEKKLVKFHDSVAANI